MPIIFLFEHTSQHPATQTGVPNRRTKTAPQNGNPKFTCHARWPCRHFCGLLQWQVRGKPPHLPALPLSERPRRQPPLAGDFRLGRGRRWGHVGQAHLSAILDRGGAYYVEQQMSVSCARIWYKSDTCRVTF